MMKKIIIALLAAAMLIPTFAACQSKPKVTTQTQAEAPASTEPQQVVTVNPVIVEKNYKQVAIDYTKQMIKQYFDLHSGRLNTTPNGNEAVAWGVGVFGEALTEAYRLMPEDETIKKAYLKFLDVTVQKYRVSFTTLDRKRIVYYNSGAGGQGDYYFDDDEWIAIVYLEAYQLLGNKQYLKWAEEILDLVWYGWEKGGNAGVPWKNDGAGVTGPLSCSNGPAVVAYTIHYQITKNETSLERAKTIYDWMRNNLLENDLYKDGPGNGWKGNYNQGTMIYGGVQLYKITGEERYLTETQATVKSAFGNGLKRVGRKEFTDFTNDNDNPWMSGWLVRGFIEFFDVDDTKRVLYLDGVADVMEKALAKQQKNGYIPVNFETEKPSDIDYDVVKQGGIPVLFAILAAWQQKWDGVAY